VIDACHVNDDHFKYRIGTSAKLPGTVALTVPILSRKGRFAFLQGGAGLIARNGFAAIQLRQPPSDFFIDRLAVRSQPFIFAAQYFERPIT
jgi:hypothetical protein